MRFSAEAKAKFLKFAQSADAPWRGNFRDLTASVTRLATLAEGGRISGPLVNAEIQRLKWLWGRGEALAGGEGGLPALLGTQAWEALDLFDRLQLEAVVSVCRDAGSLSEAGRRLFHASRQTRSVVNDADRLRKYLLRFGLRWEQIDRQQVPQAE